VITRKTAASELAKTGSSIEEVPLSSVKLWNDNPRINDAAVPKLAESFIIHGQVTPGVVWRKNKTIYKGNTSWKAIKWIGNQIKKGELDIQFICRGLADKAQRLRLSPKNEDKIEADSILAFVEKNRFNFFHGIFSILFVDFPSEQAAIAYGIADNKSSEWAQWDDSILLKFLEQDAVRPESGFTEQEYRGIAMLPDLDKINKINAENSGLKDKIIVLVLDAAKKGEVKELLQDWITTTGLEGVEIK
jgi:hypothetical protein